ncbi:MAG: hypothetical protein K8T90_19795 [Planctomycetes bacterium]|nr:hypothetical protein [Planctomycetota bacterium]
MKLACLDARSRHRLRLCASAFAAVVGAVLAPAALAHDSATDGVDLDPIEDHVVEAKAGTSDKKTAAKYGQMSRVMKPADKPGVGDDLAKTSAVRKIALRLTPADAVLGQLLTDAIAAADASLAVGEPDALSDLIQRIRKSSDRAKVEAAGMKAQDLRIAARALLDTNDVSPAISKLKASAAAYDKAAKLARSLVKRQGGGLPQFKTAVARNIYTVAGTGAGGFNGTGRSALRSSLYFVDDVTIGPDGLLYVCDWNNHRVRVREADGRFATVCGSGNPGDSEGAADTTELNHMSQLAFAPDGRMFIAAWHNHKIKVYDNSGPAPVVYTIAGGTQGKSTVDNTPATDSRFNLVPGLLILPPNHPLGGGDLLLTDATNARVMCVRLGTHPVNATNVAGVPVETGTCDRIFGTGTEGYTGDGGQALAADFQFSKSQNAQPDGRMAIDAAGNIYIVMGVKHVVRKIAPTGIVTTLAGNGTAGFSGDGGQANAAQLSSPSDVAVGPDGSIYISDTGNQVIRRVATDGTITTYAGSAGLIGYEGDDGPATGARFDHPSGIDVDPNGNLYVCDRDNSVIRVIPSATPGDLPLPVDAYTLPRRTRGGIPAKGMAGTIATYAGSGTLGFNGNDLPSRDTDLYWPQDVAVDPANGLVHFLDWNNHRIRRVNDDGTITTVVGSGYLGDDTGDGDSVAMNHPTDIAFDPLVGDLWIAAWHTDKILRLDSGTQQIVYMAGGKRGFAGDGGPANLAQLNLASSVKFDASGNWYIADEANRRVRFVNRQTNVITTIAGTGFATDATHILGDGGPAVSATLNFPVGQSAQPGGRICLDPTERFLYIADTDNHRVRRIDLQTGIITTIAGTGSKTDSMHAKGDGALATDATLSSPVDVDCDSAGNVYVADRDNDSVRKIAITTGVITTIAGGNGKGYAGDGGEAAAAQLDRPCGIFVQRNTGRLFVADTYNGVIRVIWE